MLDTLMASNWMVGVQDGHCLQSKSVHDKSYKDQLTVQKDAVNNLQDVLKYVPLCTHSSVCYLHTLCF